MLSFVALYALSAVANAAASSTTYSIVTASNAPPTASAPTVHNGKNYIEYETVTGFFLQDEPTTNATSFNYVRSHGGFSHPSDAIRLLQISASLTESIQAMPATRIKRLGSDSTSILDP